MKVDESDKKDNQELNQRLIRANVTIGSRTCRQCLLIV